MQGIQTLWVSCCIWTPAPQLPSGEAVERAPAFLNPGLPICAMGMVLANPHRAMGTVEKKYIQHRVCSTAESGGAQN